MVLAAHFTELQDINQLLQVVQNRGGVVSDQIHNDLWSSVKIVFDDRDQEDDAIGQLESHPCVQQMEIVQMLDRPVESVNTMGDEPSEQDELNNSLDSDSRPRRAAKNSRTMPHIMTEVSKLHAEGTTGQGVKIALLDSGVSAFKEQADQ
ncbi:hypothetical protein CDD83_5359 [Cordyceps sp. RAO-2017]|nr:hypothetical protein CDD83_5359 [Cordyceps sp. RAO-2017]